MSLCMSLCMSVCMSIIMYECTYVRMSLCMSLCVYVCCYSGPVRPHKLSRLSGHLKDVPSCCVWLGRCNLYPLGPQQDDLHPTAVSPFWSYHCIGHQRPDREMGVHTYTCILTIVHALYVYTDFRMTYICTSSLSPAGRQCAVCHFCHLNMTLCRISFLSPTMTLCHMSWMSPVR